MGEPIIEPVIPNFEHFLLYDVKITQNASEFENLPIELADQFDEVEYYE